MMRWTSFQSVLAILNHLLVKDLKLKHRRFWLLLRYRVPRWLMAHPMAWSLTPGRSGARKHHLSEPLAIVGRCIKS